MALPSQTERSNETARPVMSRSSRRRSPERIKFALGLVVLLVAAGAVYGIAQLFPRGTKPGSADAGTAPLSPARKPTKSTTAIARTPTQDLGGPAIPSTAPRVITQAPSTTPQTSLSQALSQSNPPPALRVDPARPGTDPSKPGPVDVTSPTLRPTSPPPPATITTPAPAPAIPVPTTPTAGFTQQVRSLVEAGDRALAANNLVEARLQFSRALQNKDASPADQQALRQKLTTINEDLLFSPRIAAKDGLTAAYIVESGDSLARIRKSQQLAVDWLLIQRINQIKNPNSIRVGQKLKLVRGPFHAVVHKSEYRLDIFAGSPDEPQDWLYIRSFRVGLGERDGTPNGTFVIKKGSKLVNPPWTNPRTGEYFEADDTKNPIGEFWLGWEGLGDAAVYTGFGLHGTVEPDSIGQQRSMGCVRMLPDDIAMVYELLVDQISIVKVLP